MLTTGALKYLLHSLTASFSAQIVGDDAAWSAQASDAFVCRSGCCMQVACTQLLKHGREVTTAAGPLHHHDNTITAVGKQNQ